MNETIPPLPGVPQQSQTSTLAIWSLVLGILSLTCLSILSGIPAVICGHKAISKINKSGGRLTGNGMAIAGLVMGYLGMTVIFIAFTGLLAAIAIPNFVKARQTSMQNMCMNDLREIQAAKNEWALEKNKSGGDIPAANDLTPYLLDGKFPAFPEGATYTIGAVTNPATCSIFGHELSSN